MYTSGYLEKQSHDMLQRWQRRWFVLDVSTKTITYYEDTSKISKKGQYTISNVNGNAPAMNGRPHMICVTGTNNKTLLMSASSASLKNGWVNAIQDALNGKSFSVSKDLEAFNIEHKESTPLIAGSEKAARSNLVLYLENLSLLSQMIGISTTYILLINMLPTSTSGPTSCDDTFFVYQNPSTGICVGTDIGVLVLGVHLIIDVTFATIVAHGINFKSAVFDIQANAGWYLYSWNEYDSVYRFGVYQLIFYAVAYVAMGLVVYIVDMFGFSLATLYISETCYLGPLIVIVYCSLVLLYRLNSTQRSEATPFVADVTLKSRVVA